MRFTRSTSVFACVVLFVSATALGQSLTPLYPNAALSQGAGCFSQRCFMDIEGFDGTTAVNSNTGAGIGIHVRSAGPQWTVQQQLTNPDEPPPSRDPAMAREQIFGGVAAVHGNYMLVAGSSRRYAFKDVIYVYQRTNGVWTHRQTFPLQRPEGFDRTLVQDIAMHGDTALISGVRVSDTTTRALTRVDVYKRDANGLYARRDVLRFPVELTEYTDHILALDGNVALVSENLQGRVYIFERRRAGWVRVRALSSDYSTTGEFGASVAVSGTTIAISEPYRPHPTDANQNGAVHLYSRVNGQWLPIKQVYAPTPSEERFTFGNTIALSGDRLVVGTDTNEFSATLPSFALLFERRDDWPAVGALRLDEGLAVRQVALAGGTAIVRGTDFAYATPAMVFEVPLLWTLPSVP